MIKKIKQKLKKEEHKRLLSNFFSLSSIQFISYIFPLITIPYLTRVLGVEKFGLVMFAQAVIQYFVIFSDYGFGLSATKEIAQKRDNIEETSKIFFSVIFIKLFFLLISFIILTIIVFSFDRFKSDWKLYYLTFGIVVGHVMFPVWFFQGIEKMHITAIINAIPKIFFMLLIFIFIRTSEDYLYVPLLNSLGFIIAGVFSFYLAFKQYPLKFVFPNKCFIIKQLKEGWHIFLGILSSNMILLNTTFLLGILTNSKMVGYYSAVEKIIRPIVSLLRPIINAIYPHLARLAKFEPEKAINFSKKISFIVSFVMFILGLILFLFSDFIIKFIFGEEYQVSSIILKIMAFIPLLKGIIDIYLIPNLIIFNLKKIYSKILFIGMMINIVLSFILINNFNSIGAAVTIVFTDIYLVIMMNFYLKKYVKV